MRIITHIYTRYPRVTAVAIGSVIRTDFGIHSVILGKCEEILCLYIETQLGDALPRDKFLEVVAQGEVLQTDVVALL